jgi:hypothetical protein
MTLHSPPRRHFLHQCSLAAGALALAPWAKRAHAVETAPAPADKIVPGKAIVPFQRMRRPWGELINLDLSTRTGKFRQEKDDQVISFDVLPFAELYHHAAFGDLQDFSVGDRAIFRLHEDDAGNWTRLTYIQDEMNFLFGHKEYYYVDRVDSTTGQIEVTDANADKSFVRTQHILLETDGQTRYGRLGQPARFVDIRLGDKLRTKTHGRGKGAARICSDVFLDDESLLKVQAQQQAVHARRMAEDGLPGYVDLCQGRDLQLTLFRETQPIIGKLKAGQTAARLAPAGVDRRPNGPRLNGKLTGIKSVSNGLTQVTLLLEDAGEAPPPLALARLWAGS